MTFFSGTDTDTLREEGDERNHFVSLIVNNAGNYTAAITRKVKYHSVRDLSYEGFDGPVNIDEKDESDGEEIEWFNLEIVFEEPVEDPFKAVSERLDEIKKKKETAFSAKTSFSSYGGYKPYSKEYADNYDYESMWDKYNNKVPTTTNVYDKKYPSLFDKVEEKSSPKEEVVEETKDAIISKAKLDEIVVQLVTGSVTITTLGKDARKKVFDSMKNRFDKRFGKDTSLNEFEYWATDFIEFLLWWSIDMQISNDDEIAAICELIIKELSKLPKNRYLESYIEILNDYVGKYQ